jgi:hypothetical protein
MSKYLIIIITLFPFVGCTSITQSDYFEKKQECEKYANQYEELYGIKLHEIFYSPKINSCVANYSTDSYFNGWTNTEIFEDALTKEVKASFVYEIILGENDQNIIRYTKYENGSDSAYESAKKLSEVREIFIRDLKDG